MFEVSGGVKMAKPSADELFKKYEKNVYNIAYRLTGNRQDAEDVTQETFMRVHKNLDNFRGDAHPYTWIYRIAVNCSLQIKRQLDKKYIDSLDEKMEIMKNDIPDEVRGWAGTPENRYLYDTLLEYIRDECYHFMTFRLNDTQRTVYVLRVILGFSLDEISAILETSKGVIKARLQRAKTALKTYFDGRCQWTSKDPSCSCESRIGFALSFAPDLLKRLKNVPPDRRTKALVEETLASAGTVDEFYRRLEPEERLQVS